MHDVMSPQVIVTVLLGLKVIKSFTGFTGMWLKYVIRSYTTCMFNRYRAIVFLCEIKLLILVL